MQRPKSEGLGAAFGGGMTENLFGAQTTNVLANATRWLAGTFFLLTLLISVLISHQTATKSKIAESLANAPKPVVTATPALSGSAAAALDAMTNALKKQGIKLQQTGDTVVSKATPAASPAPNAEASPAPSTEAPPAPTTAPSPAAAK